MIKIGLIFILQRSCLNKYLGWKLQDEKGSLTNAAATKTGWVKWANKPRLCNAELTQDYQNQNRLYCIIIII